MTSGQGVIYPLATSRGMSEKVVSKGGRERNRANMLISEAKQSVNHCLATSEILSSFQLS